MKRIANVTAEIVSHVLVQNLARAMNVAGKPSLTASHRANFHRSIHEQHWIDCVCRGVKRC